MQGVLANGKIVRVDFEYSHKRFSESEVAQTNAMVTVFDTEQVEALEEGQEQGEVTQRILGFSKGNCIKPMEFVSSSLRSGSGKELMRKEALKDAFKKLATKFPDLLNRDERTQFWVNTYLFTTRDGKRILNQQGVLSLLQQAHEEPTLVIEDQMVESVA